MNSRNSYLIVGAFISVGVIALITIILMFSGGRSAEPSVRYIVLFERDISGLTLGAPVRYLGVDVGQVVATSLMLENGTRVRVDIEVLQSTPLTSASYASLAFQGITGVAFISLASDHVVDAMPMQAGHFEYPVIPARDTGLAALLSAGPEISHKASLLLDRANKLLNQGNQDRLARSLVNIEKLTAVMASQQDAIEELPQQLKSVLSQIESTVSGFQTTLEQAEPDLLATMQTLNKTSENLTNISARMDDWLTEHDDDMQLFIDGGLAKTPALVADTRNTMRELEKLLGEMRENPSQLVYKRQSDAVVIEE